MSQEAGSADVGPTVDAVWMEREILVTYMAFTSFYSCRGLRDKVTWVLEELGARPGFKVTTRGCVEVTGPGGDAGRQDRGRTAGGGDA